MAVTLYYVVVQSGATPPTGAQVVAGVSYTGGTVLDAGSVAYTAAGTYDDNASPVTGASAGTAYDQYWVAYDGVTYGTVSPAGAIRTANAVTAALIASTATIGAHTVTRAAVAAVTATRIEPTVTFGTATVSRVAVAAVSLARIESTTTVAAPVVARASVQAVTASRIESAVSFGAAIVSANGIAAVAPARIESAVAFGIPTVSATGPAQIAVGRIESAAIVRAPLVVRTGPDVEEATSGKGRRKRRPMMAGTPYTHDDYMQWVVRTVAAVAATGVFDA